MAHNKQRQDELNQKLEKLPETSQSLFEEQRFLIEKCDDFGNKVIINIT